MNEKIGMYTEEEIFQEIAHGFLGRSMYGAIFDKIHALKTENEQLQQENAQLKNKLKDIEKILDADCCVENVYQAICQYLNIHDFELDLEDYLKEK